MHCVSTTIIKRKIKMDTPGIALIILGVLSIAVGVLGKFRPDIVYRDWSEKRTIGGFRLFGFSAFRLGGEKMNFEDRQRFGFVTFILFGVMLILASIASSVPQWEAYKSAITISIVMLMTVVLLFAFWKIMLSQDESRGRIAFAIVMLLAFAMIAFVVYYWHVTLK